ncbi:MAG: radical SAM protein [Methanophagales archaeon]|nr:radical SAM protein [Methanophagales archaeon]
MYPQDFEQLRLVHSKKEIHGWWNGIEPHGNRECTSERLLINPYNGCSHDCFFCYAHAFPGYFDLFRKSGMITVFEDFDKVVAKQLDSIRVASCGYLSPVTDPFQPINERYQLTEKIMAAFVRRNIPVEVVTKGVISDKAMRLLAEQEHSFGQVSILTSDEDKRRRMMAGGASTEELIKNIEQLSNRGIFAVCRIDPVLPFITSKEEELEELIKAVVDAGASHIITSCLDIPKTMEREIYERIEHEFGKETRKKYAELYVEEMSGRKHAKIEYRRKLFGMIKRICKEQERGRGVTMSLCMEFERIRSQQGYGMPKSRFKFKGLNQEFMTSRNCEGIDIPIYVQRDGGERFSPVEGCDGNCLRCYRLGKEREREKERNKCGIEDLGKAGAWKLRDYKRWSKVVEGEGKQATLNFSFL